MPVQAYQKIFNLPRVNPGQFRALYTKRTAFVFIKEHLMFCWPTDERDRKR